MPIILKTSREIEMMRRAGKVARDMLDRMEQVAVPGATTVATRLAGPAQLDWSTPSP